MSLTVWHWPISYQVLCKHTELIISQVSEYVSTLNTDTPFVATKTPCSRYQMHECCVFCGKVLSGRRRSVRHLSVVGKTFWNFPPNNRIKLTTHWQAKLFKRRFHKRCVLLKHRFKCSSSFTCITQHCLWGNRVLTI